MNAMVSGDCLGSQIVTPLPHKILSVPLKSMNYISLQPQSPIRLFVCFLFFCF